MGANTSLIPDHLKLSSYFTLMPNVLVRHTSLATVYSVFQNDARPATDAEPACCRAWNAVRADRRIDRGDDLGERMFAISRKQSR